MLSVLKHSLLARHRTNHWARTLLARKPKPIIVLLRGLHESTTDAQPKKDPKEEKRVGTNLEVDYIYDQTGRKLPTKFIRIRMWQREQEQKLVEAVYRNVHMNGDVDWKQVAKELDINRSAAACRTKYQALMVKEHGEQDAPLVHARRIETALRTKYELTEEAYQMNIQLEGRSTQWNAEDDDNLLNYVAIVGPKWTKVASLIGNPTANQCRVRYMFLIKQGKTKEKDTEESREPPAVAKPPRIPKRKWTPENDQQLFKLIENGIGTKLRDLLPHFPEFGMTQVYGALSRLRAGPELKTGRWSVEEHQALVELVQRHGTENWTLISEGMPTPKRIAMQCRSRYYRTNVYPSNKRREWTDEEVQKLRLLVELYHQGKLVPIERLIAGGKGLKEGKGLPNTHEGEEEMMLGSRLIRLMEAAAAAAANHRDEKEPPPKMTRRHGKIPWHTIASYMLTRTANQCGSKWSVLAINANETSQPSTEPWSLEEDVQLYKLYASAPNQWKWIMDSLPRKRLYGQVVRRHTIYISKYVEMLRECRGPQWDPLADGFEEVHMRCEIWAWYKGTMIGYRAQDPQKCPYHF